MAGPHAALVTRTLVSLSPLACSVEFNIRCYVSLHAQNSLTEEFCSAITSFTVENDELPRWLQDQGGLSLDKSISRARRLDAESTDASQAAPEEVNLLIRTLRRAIAWLNGLDAPVNYDDMLKRLSLAEARAITMNTGGLVIGLLSVGAALFTGCMYLLLQTWQGIIIPFSYAVLMTGVLFLLRPLNVRLSRQRSRLFQV